jgi:hypothetical protein
MIDWKNCIPCLINPHRHTQGFVQEMNQVQASLDTIYTGRKKDNKGLVYFSINAEEEKLYDITEKHLKLSLGRNKKIQYVQGNFILYIQ